MIAYYTGVRPGDPNGHYPYVPGYALARDGVVSPWGWARWPAAEGLPTTHYPFFWNAE